MKRYSWIAALLSSSLSAAIAPAQTTPNASQKMQSDFLYRVTSEPFPALGTWATITGDSIDFSNIRSPTIIRFGFRYCGPCNFEMPYLITLSKQFPQLNFVYVSFDERDTIINDVKKHYEETGKMQFVHMPQQFINAKALTFRYPTTYFIAAGNQVKQVNIGGATADKGNLLARYKYMIDSVYQLPH